MPHSAGTKSHCFEPCFQEPPGLPRQTPERDELLFVEQIGQRGLGQGQDNACVADVRCDKQRRHCVNVRLQQVQKSVHSKYKKKKVFATAREDLFFFAGLKSSKKPDNKPHSWQR
jgi:hypothetical protein